MTDISLQKYYEARLDMFASKGWREFIEDLDKRINAIQNIKGINDVETLFRRQGELECLEWIKNLEDMSKETYDQLKEDGTIA